MYFTLGSYSTGNNSSWHSIRKRAIVGQTGRKIADREFWSIHTVLTAASQSALQTAITAHLAGMKQNNVDLTFYTDAGAETADKIVNSQTSDGITYKGHEFPGMFPGQWGAHTEHVYVRYVVTHHEATVLDVENTILFYNQSFQFNVGGSDYEVLGAFTGPPVTQFTMQQVPCWGIQQGTAVGMFSHPQPPGPLFAVPIKPRTSPITRKTPQKFGRVQNWGYPTSWRYLFESPFPLDGTPPDVF